MNKFLKYKKRIFNLYQFKRDLNSVYFFMKSKRIKLVIAWFMKSKRIKLVIAWA